MLGSRWGTCLKAHSLPGSAATVPTIPRGQSTLRTPHSPPVRLFRVRPPPARGGAVALEDAEAICDQRRVSADGIDAKDKLRKMRDGLERLN